MSFITGFLIGILTMFCVFGTWLIYLMDNQNYKGLGMSKDIEICVEIKRETDAAFLVTDDGNSQSWLPKSQIQTDQNCEPGDTVIFTMPEWLAIDKGFV